MNPVLSWVIVFLIALGFYVAINGGPKKLTDRLYKSQDTLQNLDAKKRNKRKARSARASTSQQGNSSSEDNSQGLAVPKHILREQNKDHVDVLSSLSDQGHNQDGSSQAKQIARHRAPAKFTAKDGHYESVPNTTKLNGLDTQNRPISEGGRLLVEPGREQEILPRMPLAEAQWQTRRGKYVPNDMLEPDTSFVARTLKIVPSQNNPTTAAQPSNKQNRKLETQIQTKKQRQNAAKKAKLQAEKTELQHQQEVALRQHKLNQERSRILESARNQKSSSSTPKPNHWQDEWTTVVKPKKLNEAKSSSTSEDKLIWETD